MIPNGVDVAHFGQVFPEEELESLREKLGKGKDEVWLVHTGRLVPKNGIEHILRALPGLPKHVRFLSIGNGPDEAKLKRLAQELGIGDRIIWQGFLPHSEIPKYLKISDIFIRPSLSEGLGNSFLEAMAAGLPVIATPVGGIPDFLFDTTVDDKHKQTGYLCAPSDPASIVRAVTRVLEDGERCERVVRNASEMVGARYDWEMVAREMGELFESIAVKQ